MSPEDFDVIIINGKIKSRIGNILEQLIRVMAYTAGRTPIKNALETRYQCKFFFPFLKPHDLGIYLLLIELVGCSLCFFAEYRSSIFFDIPVTVSDRKIQWKSEFCFFTALGIPDLNFLSRAIWATLNS